jgi:integrase
MKFVFDGHLVQQSTKCSNKRDALTVESAYRTQLALGKIGIEPKREVPKFENAVDDFLLWAKVKHQESVTYNRYYFACKTLKAFFGRIKVNRIETKDVEKFITWRSDQMSRKTKELISRETVNREVLTFKIIFNRLIEERILQTNPARSIKKLPENETTFHVITKDEERLYLLACPPLLQDVATIMLETGMRCGEVYRIRRSEVNLENNYLQITKGKTKSSIRRVYLSDKARHIIESRMNNFKGENLFPKRDIDFSAPTGSLDHQHAKVMAELNFNFRIYDSRHTFATRAVEQDINLVTLAAILGHASLKMVMRYAHPSENEKRDAIKKMQTGSGKRKAKAVHQR